MKILHVRIEEEVWQKLQKISIREARPIPQVVRLALAEVGTRGFTDTLNGKEEAAKRKRMAK